MGLPMARNMARAGIDVRAWNRSAEKAASLADDGATVAGSPAEAADGATVLLTMLADADAVTETVKQALPALGAGTIWLQMSTIGEAGTDRCAELAAEHALTLLDAPVLGTKAPAEQGKLVVLCSGDESLRGRVDGIFDAIAARTMWVGEVGQGTRLKLVANGWVLTIVEGTAETVALAQGMGLDPALLFEAVQGGAMDLPYLHMKGQAILDGNFEPSFRLALAMKDAGLIEESARRRDLELPLFSLIKEQMAKAAPDHGDEDMIATYFASAPEG
jgi:3-hydroxyisobutyrate dehydrogenase